MSSECLYCFTNFRCVSRWMRIPSYDFKLGSILFYQKACTFQARLCCLDTRYNVKPFFNIIFFIWMFQSVVSSDQCMCRCNKDPEKYSDGNGVYSLPLMPMFLVKLWHQHHWVSCRSCTGWYACEVTLHYDMQLLNWTLENRTVCTAMMIHSAFWAFLAEQDDQQWSS